MLGTWHNRPWLFNSLPFRDFLSLALNAGMNSMSRKDNSPNLSLLLFLDP